MIHFATKKRYVDFIASKVLTLWSLLFSYSFQSYSMFLAVQSLLSVSQLSAKYILRHVITNKKFELKPFVIELPFVTSSNQA